MEIVTTSISPDQLMTGKVLASTAAGQYYSDLFYQLSPEINQAVIASPTFLVRLWIAKDEWLAGLQALVDGQGDQFVITPAMQSSLDALLDTFESVGSSSLASTIAFERTRLGLGAIGGMTMTQYQTQVETLGGPTAVRPTTWSAMKAAYR